jgi:hypothetical protein
MKVLNKEQWNGRGFLYRYLSYTKYCAVSAVTDGPTEEMNGVPIPAELIFEKSQLAESNEFEKLPSRSIYVPCFVRA